MAFGSRHQKPKKLMRQREVDHWVRLIGPDKAPKAKRGLTKRERLERAVAEHRRLLDD